ncbi:MAG: hypothetical protein QGF59_24570, partial [Pirellulaceae bacterium]|nr:hypothetical protein [Pirellulaceae bacterium]
MAIDTIPETQRPPQRPRAQQPSGRQHCSPQGRWLRRGLLAFGVIVALVSVAAWITSAMRSPETGPRLTHAITRGDLLVTVTEQGILESSENTEIKCKVRGRNTVIWVVESGTMVKPGDELVRLDTLFMQEQIDERTKYAH